MKLTQGQRAHGLSPDGCWVFFTVQKQLRAGLVLGSDRRRYTQAIPAFPEVADSEHCCLQAGLEIVRSIPDHVEPGDADDAFGLLNALGQVPGCRKALWALLSTGEKQAVTALRATAGLV